MTLESAGRFRITDDERLEVRESIAVRRCQNAGCVERRLATRREKVAVRCRAAKPRGSDAKLVADLEREASNGEDA